MAFLVEPGANQETLLADHEEASNKHGLLVHALSRLPERERDILQRRKLKEDPDTLETLSQEYNISRERVRQIEVRAFEKIQKDMLEQQAA